MVEHRFDPEVPLTLHMLEELQVFDHAEAIQEVSGQASSEASLEAILKKVCVCTLYYALTIGCCVCMFILLRWRTHGNQQSL